MKTQTQFKNASLVSVVNGSIVVKDSTGREHTFANASVVSVNNGTIIIESEWEPKRGELIKFRCGWCDTKYAIFKEIVGDRFWMYCSSIDTLTELPWDLNCPKYVSIIDGSFTLSPVTPEEQKEFDDFCKSQGKLWNKEKLQWEKYRWKPIKDVRYFHIIIAGGTIQVDDYRWVGDGIDKNLYDMGNCFKTEEEAKVMMEKIKKLLLEV